MLQNRSRIWAQLFELPRGSGLPLQVQLRSVIVRAISERHLAAGAALPSSRDLARALRLSRNTVSASYEQLISDGFLIAKPRCGVFVSQPDPWPAARLDSSLDGDHGSDRDIAPDTNPDNDAKDTRRPPNWSRRMLRTLAHVPTLTKPEAWQSYPFPFVYGHHDAQQFPVDDFRECCVRSLARSQLPEWTPDFEREDAPALIEQIRARLLPRRGVYAQDHEILVTVGAQQAWQLLAELLFAAQTRVGFEDPGYPHARNTFSLREPALIPLPIDDEGVRVEPLPALDYLFVTPSHQSPTTATLSLNRRKQLLALAEQRDFVVIEDDYEAESLHRGEVMPALKSMDRSGRVIHVGSLSKSLSPAVRLGYIVAPSRVIAELRVLRHAMVRHPSAFLQHAYALFISLGHHESHARRVNQLMRDRVQATAAALRAHLPEFHFQEPGGGASIWVRAPAHMDGHRLALAARRHGVLIEPGAVFFADPPDPCPYFRLRLSSIPSDRIDAGIQALRQAVIESNEPPAAPAE
jgi:GntR family transcriptional regulator/MocR family aminotransferase